MQDFHNVKEGDSVVLVATGETVHDCLAKLTVGKDVSVPPVEEAVFPYTNSDFRFSSNGSDGFRVINNVTNTIVLLVDKYDRPSPKYILCVWVEDAKAEKLNMDGKLGHFQEIFLVRPGLVARAMRTWFAKTDKTLEFHRFDGYDDIYRPWWDRQPNKD